MWKGLPQIDAIRWRDAIAPTCFHVMYQWYVLYQAATLLVPSQASQTRHERYPLLALLPPLLPAGISRPFRKEGNHSPPWSGQRRQNDAAASTADGDRPAFSTDRSAQSRNLRSRGRRDVSGMVSAEQNWSVTTSYVPSCRALDWMAILGRRVLFVTSI